MDLSGKLGLIIAPSSSGKTKALINLLSRDRRAILVCSNATRRDRVARLHRDMTNRILTKEELPFKNFVPSRHLFDDYFDYFPELQKDDLAIGTQPCEIMIMHCRPLNFRNLSGIVICPRRSGKTTELLRILKTDDKFTLVTPNTHQRDQLRNDRPDLANRIISSSQPRPSRGPCLFDEWFFYYAPLEPGDLAVGSPSYNITIVS